ncbi:MAG: TonB-dependent receptor, partial [Gemmatimonadaceae bacterium]|nr:TonB-dependent receptor [Gloeobacterales cyanobacterium ES-bin-141]
FISFRANWSQVFNAPNLGDLYLVGGVFVDNPRLQPETGVTYDVGVDITPARNLGFRLTYFSTYINGVFGNLIFVNPNINNPTSPTFGEPLIQQVNNLAGRRATGIEFSADWRLTDQIQLRAAWTNTDARDIGRTDNIGDSSFPFNYEYQLTGIPFNNVVVAATYLNKGLLVSLLARYDSGKRRGATNLFVPAWATLDLNVELPVTPFLTVTGNVFNLTDTQYEYVSNSPAPGTTFRVGARLELGG